MEVCNACGDGPCFKDISGKKVEISVRCGKPSSPIWRDMVRDSGTGYDLLYKLLAESENIEREISYALDSICGVETGEEIKK